MEAAQREFDFFHGPGYNHELSSSPLSRRIVRASTEGIVKAMSNVSATDCDGDNESVVEERVDILPTLFTMPLTYCSESHAGNRRIGGFSELAPSHEFFPRHCGKAECQAAYIASSLYNSK